MQYKRIVRHFAAFRRTIVHIDAGRQAKKSRDGRRTTERP